MSLWGSQSYGYSSNPLHTFAEEGDHVAQSFLQVGYSDPTASSSPGILYTGGLVLFDRLRARNYFEQSLRGSTYLRFGRSASVTPPVAPDSTDSSDEAGESGAYADTGRPYLLLSVNGTSRHDRDTVKTYDNEDLTVAGLFRSYISPNTRLKIENDVDFRNYPFVQELSNLTNTTTVSFDFDAGKPLMIGTSAGLLLKYYSTSTYDTSVFEPKRTFNPKSQGKGKGGGQLNNPHVKQILINPTTARAVQVFAGVSAFAQWSGGMASANVIYRINPGPTPRYLAQTANFSLVREDIYGDYMEYHGPECSVQASQEVLFHIRMTISAEARSSVFSVPALDLIGNQTSPSRKDLRGGVEVTLSRYIDLGAGFGLEIGATGTLLRNQSNDEYNDYGVRALAFEAGLGF